MGVCVWCAYAHSGTKHSSHYTQQQTTTQLDMESYSNEYYCPPVLAVRARGTLYAYIRPRQFQFLNTYIRIFGGHDRHIQPTAPN